jgi:creatinine amidohydrolase
LPLLLIGSGVIVARNFAIESILDIVPSLAYHGFRKVVLLNGHGSNTPCLDLAARRGNLETTATCAFVSWWQLLTIDKAFLKQWRQSIFPGGCAHACELETSLYLHIDEGAVRTDLIEDDVSAVPTESFAAEAMWVNLFAAGAVSVTSWTSRRSRAGVFGQARLATKAKGESAFNEACRQLGRLVTHLKQTELPSRKEHHGTSVPMPPPWNERPLTETPAR